MEISNGCCRMESGFVIMGDREFVVQPIAERLEGQNISTVKSKTE